MTSMAQRQERRWPIVTAVLVFLFWALAAGIAAMSSGRAAVAIPAIAGAAYAYTRLCAKRAGVAHALGVGIAWLVLAIAAEVAVGGRMGRGWYGLIGSPERPLLRNILLFVWVFAPALFARREAELKKPLRFDSSIR